MVFPECSRNLFKVTASRAHWQIKNEVFHFDIAETPRNLSKVTIKKESTHKMQWIDSYIVDLQRIDILMLPPHLRHREI